MKVKLPKNKAQAFDELTAFGKDDILAGVMGYGCNSKFPEGKTWSELRALAKHDFETFLQALANGYEVEETPEAKVREYYNQQNSICTERMDTGADVIRNVLNLLGKEIEGVNA